MEQIVCGPDRKGRGENGNARGTATVRMGVHGRRQLDPCLRSPCRRNTVPTPDGGDFAKRLLSSESVRSIDKNLLHPQKFLSCAMCAVSRTRPDCNAVAARGRRESIQKLGGRDVGSHSQSHASDSIESQSLCRIGKNATHRMGRLGLYALLGGEDKRVSRRSMERMTSRVAFYKARRKLFKTIFASPVFLRKPRLTSIPRAIYSTPRCTRNQEKISDNSNAIWINGVMQALGTPRNASKIANGFAMLDESSCCSRAGWDHG